MSDTPMILEWVDGSRVVRPMTPQEQAEMLAPSAHVSVILTPAQWGFFLDVSGFRDALDAALDAMPKATMQERQAWAGFRNVAYNSNEYRLDVTLALVAQVRNAGLPVAIPSDAEIEAAFTAASEFQGAASLGVGA